MTLADAARTYLALVHDPVEAGQPNAPVADADCVRLVLAKTILRAAKINVMNARKLRALVKAGA